MRLTVVWNRSSRRDLRSPDNASCFCHEIIGRALLYFQRKRGGVLAPVHGATARAVGHICQMERMLPWADAQRVDCEARVELLRIEAEQLYGGWE
jgi:hypothetical protein